VRGFPARSGQGGDKKRDTHRPLSQKILPQQHCTKISSPTSTTNCASNSDSISTIYIPLESPSIAGHFALKFDYFFQDLRYLVDPFVDGFLIQLMPAILNGFNEVLVGQAHAAFDFPFRQAPTALNRRPI